MALRLELDDNPEFIERLHKTVLLRKYFCGKRISKFTMKKIVTGVWNLRGGVEVETPYEEEISETNIFAFEFNDEEDYERVLKLSPWLVANNLLNVQRWDLGKKVVTKDLMKCPLWIQVRGIPPQKRSEYNAKQIAGSIGEWVSTEGIEPGVIGVRPFFWIKVVLNTENPLPRGFWMANKPDPDSWVSFKYERLGTFCYRCGRVGHLEMACIFKSKTQGNESEYSAELWAEPRQKESIKDAYRNRHDGRCGTEFNKKKMESLVAARENDEEDEEEGSVGLQGRTEYNRNPAGNITIEKGHCTEEGMMSTCHDGRETRNIPTVIQLQEDCNTPHFW